jgi:pimeloyl-ACP methyl ester carboxylesterase
LDTETFTWAFADLRGYGAARDGGPATFTVEEAAGDVLAAADRLGWGRFSVVGHSMSTIVALHLAQTSAARVERVVLTTPPPPKGFGYDAATHARLQEVARGDDTQRARALAFMLGDRLGPEWLRFKLARWRESVRRLLGKQRRRERRTERLLGPRRQRVQRRGAGAFRHRAAQPRAGKSAELTPVLSTKHWSCPASRSVGPVV